MTDEQLRNRKSKYTILRMNIFLYTLKKLSQEYELKGPIWYEINQSNGHSSTRIETTLFKDC